MSEKVEFFVNFKICLKSEEFIKKIYNSKWPIFKRNPTNCLKSKIELDKYKGIFYN